MENKYSEAIHNLRHEFHKTRLTEKISVNPQDLKEVIYPYYPIPSFNSEEKYNAALEVLAYYLHSPIPYDRSQKEHWDFAFREALDEFSK